MMFATFSLAACSSDPEWSDPEAHEQNVQLKEQYGPLMVGTWNYEYSGEKNHFTEQLTFKADGTFTGSRVWQTRSLVTVEGEERYTDWETLEELSGDFTGTWQLSYTSIAGEPKANYLFLYATFDDSEKEYVAYTDYLPFSYADSNTLCFRSKYFTDENGWASYQRGE